MKIVIALSIVIILIILLLLYMRVVNKDYINPEINLKVTSDSFNNNGSMPIKYTENGENISPNIKIDRISPQAKTIAIIMDDLDTPLGIFNHWVIWNIPASFTNIPEAVPHKNVVTTLGNAVQGKSTYGGKHYYRGPKPPFGTHRYVFKVYVLDIVLSLDENTTKAELQKAMQGHVLQYGELVGKYKK